MIKYKKRSKLILFLMLALVCSVGVFTSCNNKDGEGEGSGSGSTSGLEVTTQIEDDGTTPPEGELDLYWIQWTGSNIKRPDGSTCCWDWKTAAQKNVNKLNIHFLCRDESGNTLCGIPDVKRLKEQLDIMEYELTESEKAGVDIIGYGDTVQFVESVAAEMGYTLEQLAAKDMANRYIYTTAWNAGSYIACINSPQWREWQRESLRLMAEAGFAEFQFDFHPYAAASLFCRCNNCKTMWKEYSKKNLGEELTVPRGGLDFSKESDREYYKWKMLCLKDFKEEIEVAAKKVNPNFNIYMNDNANGYNFGFECLYEAWDGATSEFHGSNNGYSSTLYMYQLAEAFGYDSLRSQYGTDAEITPIFRLKVNYGEAFATIGGISYVARTEGDRMFSFAKRYDDVYIKTESLATAAVLYSVEGNFFSLKPQEINYNSQLFDFSTDRARQAASALLKSGVCYDYLVVEKDNAKESLAKYDLLVVPDYTYFDNDVWKPILEQAVKNGSKIVVVGSEPRKTIEGFGLSGNIVYLDSFEPANEETSFTPSLLFKNAVTDTAAAEKLVLKNNLENTAATIRSNAENLTYIHVIRRGGDENCDVHYQELEYKVTDGKKVTDVVAMSPYKNTVNASVKVDWSFENGVLKAKTADFDTYCILRVVTE